MRTCFRVAPPLCGKSPLYGEKWLPSMWITGAAFSHQCCTSHPGFQSPGLRSLPSWQFWVGFSEPLRTVPCVYNQSIGQSISLCKLGGRPLLFACLFVFSVGSTLYSQFESPPPFKVAGGFVMGVCRMVLSPWIFGPTWPSRDPLGGSSLLVVSVRYGGITA